MRIPSSLNDDNLYRQRGRRAVGRQPHRRLLRLLLAMALVIAVIRQAGNPRIYEVFFSASPATLDPAADRTHHAGGAAVSTSPSDAQPSLAEARAGKDAGPDAAGLAEDLVDAFDQADALDQRAIERVDPGSLWKASDTSAFYRLLEDPESPWLRRQSAIRASVVSLLQQPDVYLRRRITMPASVARVIQREAAENSFGVSEYWELWLRPRDGSEHPLVLFTNNVPPEITQVGPDASLREGPSVWVDGIYLKRLAYRSASGPQLAPALVGMLHAALPTSVAVGAPSSPSPGPSGWLLLGISALLGGSAALLIFSQIRREAGRTRALRRSAEARAEPFLTSLSDSQVRARGDGP